VYPVSAPFHTVRASPRWIASACAFFPHEPVTTYPGRPQQQIHRHHRELERRPALQEQDPAGGGDPEQVAQVGSASSIRRSNAEERCEISRIEAPAPGYSRSSSRTRSSTGSGDAPGPGETFHTRSTTPHALGSGSGTSPRVRSGIAFRVGCREAVDRLAGREPPALPTGDHRDPTVAERSPRALVI
jgi:hypothetical protein